MIPKFASHIFHHTSRAAATAQNHSFRNVLGFQQPPPPSSGLGGFSGAGSSSWGGYGAGPGGAKYNSGSRFYSGFQNSPRSITQANSATSQDNGHGQSDDNEELITFRQPSTSQLSGSRPRSSSLSLSRSERSRRADKFGVLKTVQLHQGRHLHGIALNASAGQIADYEDADADKFPQRVLVRRNSTSTSSASELESFYSKNSPRENPAQLLPDTLSTDPGSPQTAIPPSKQALDEDVAQFENLADWETYRRLEVARATGDPAKVIAEVKDIRQTLVNATVLEYNLVLAALADAVPNDKSITHIRETYNEMLTRQIVPNMQTYSIMILSLCERDRCVHAGIKDNENRLRNLKASDRTSFRRTAYRKRISALQKEDNLVSAMTMFSAAHALASPGKDVGLVVYNELLRSCALALDVESAIRVFALLESSRTEPNATSYYHLLSAYANSMDTEGAEEVFKEFRAASSEGRIEFEPFPMKVKSDGSRSSCARESQMLVWVKMIEAYLRGKEPAKAIEILSIMMDSKAGVTYGPSDVPPPCAAAYSAFILGFIENDDMKSALMWFDRMLTNTVISTHELHPMAQPPQPNDQAWYAIIAGLAKRRMTHDLNRVFKSLLSVHKEQGIRIRGLDRLLVLEANVAYMQGSRESISKNKANEIITFLINDVFATGPDVSSEISMGDGARSIIESFMDVLQQHKKVEEGIVFLENFAATESDALRHSARSNPEEDDTGILLPFEMKGLSMILQSAVFSLVMKVPNQVSLNHVLRIGALYDRARLTAPASILGVLLQAYRRARETVKPAELKLTPSDWGFICSTASKLVFRDFDKSNSGSIFSGGVLSDNVQSKLDILRTVLNDMNDAGICLSQLRHQDSRKIVDVLLSMYGREGLDSTLLAVNPSWAEKAKTMIKRSESVRNFTGSIPINGATTENSKSVTIDIYHGRYIEEYFPSHEKSVVETAFKRYQAGKARNVYPPPEVIGRLISSVGRSGDIAVIDELYHDAQLALRALEDDRRWQVAGWFVVENHMLVALAHTGHVDKAHIHRQRILEQGGTPSHDAYGALIQHVSETTDDCTNALELWNESQALGVPANIYMYNTIISKLSKARKADMALELFHRMKVNRLQPSPVTYGAVIAACCRVGDAQSAEVLFKEMTSQRNYKARIPPYNTMVQFYTHTIPNRDRALHYYDAMVAAGVQPTAHTYKLLIDCYGTIEPAVVGAVEAVFSRLDSDPTVNVQGVHWASLINSYGCVQKNTEKALEIFTGIRDHPSTARSGFHLPDALCFESLLNVIVVRRRPDLIPDFLSRLEESGVHMTAYIANLLIKGYSDAGDIGRSREIFESLCDPPVGVAGRNNHAPHDTLLQHPISPEEPVYREPSTWESMIRAELANRNKENAVALLQRLHSRQFPQAVYQRISGIMLDDTVAPWTPSDSFTFSG